MEGSIGPRMEICVNLGLPIVMVPCLHQSNTYIKMKLMVWRAQKCILLVGAKTTLTCTGLQTTAVHGGQYRAENGNLRKVESIPIAMVPCFHQNILALMQVAHQQEVEGMESLKMQTLLQCKKRIIRYGPANSPASCSAAQCHTVPSMEICTDWRLTQAWNNSCTNAKSTSTRSVEYGEFKKVNPTYVQKKKKKSGTALQTHPPPAAPHIVPSMEIRADLRLT